LDCLAVLHAKGCKGNCFCGCELLISFGVNEQWHLGDNCHDTSVADENAFGFCVQYDTVDFFALLWVDTEL